MLDPVLSTTAADALNCGPVQLHKAGFECSVHCAVASRELQEDAALLRSSDRTTLSAGS